MLTLEEQIEAIVDKRIAESNKPLLHELAILREFLPGEYRHKEACAYLQMSDSTLRRERDKPGTLIRYRMDGTTPIYDVASLIAYKKSKYLPVLKAA